MPIPFADVCELLEQSYSLCRARKSNAPAVHAWFRRHRTRVDAHDTDLAALLSTLLPEKRTDRVYAMQAATLERVVGRALMLGASRMGELATYRRPGAGVDLAECVERILTATPNPVQEEPLRPTVEEVDGLLHALAARIRWSAPAIRRADAGMANSSRGDLEGMYRRLAPREGKWFTRLVLKDYQPLLFDAALVYRCCDAALPCILQIRDDFTEALAAISTARGALLPTTAAAAGRNGGCGGGLSVKRVLQTVRPKLGVKIGRQQWHKGRSIKHCIDMGGGGRMSVERKMDGEYCQIHVDMGRGKGRVQIFSKSGKDSTEDRVKVIPAIERSLRLGAEDCSFKKACILEGELVVYNDLENVIMPFHKIRGHVNRRGLYLNTEQDSQPKPYEHLMMIYYDIFLLDDQSLMDVRHSERMKLLEKVVHCERGVGALVQRQTIDFGHALAASALRKAFAQVVVERGEGLVLKPDEPYIVVSERGYTKPCRCIKLKKEYIGSFGDVGDFALVGAGFHAARARTYRIPNLKWTHFFVGCLNNKEEVKRWGQKPEFTVVCAVELSEAMLESFIALGELSAVPRAENQSTKLTMPFGIECMVGMTVAFGNPAVVDLRCFSFDKPGNTGFWTPRFPAITKIHTDRDHTDALTFDELQAVARDAVDRPDLEDSQENLHWIAKLEGADPRGVAVDAVSQATATTAPTPSPCKTTQSLRTESESQASRATAELSRLSQSVVLLPSTNPEAGVTRNASVSIISISTSSAVDEISPQKSVSGALKRAPRPVSPEVSFKRPCVHSFRSKAALMNTRPNRRPLGDIDVNVSHGDTQTAESQDSLATVKLPSRQFDGNNTFCEKEVIEILSSDEEEEPTQRVDSQRLAQLDSLQHAELPETVEGTLRCKHVGGRCGLLGKTILLSSNALLQVSDVPALFDDHGVLTSTVIPCIETWWKTEMQTSGRKRSPKVKESRILLVDSVLQSVETKALIGRLNDARKDYRREESDWVSVYDWRVLKHISIAEDETVTKKYYDGFQDPWRRWYCGLV